MTNAAAIGYMIRAAKQTKLDDKTIKLLEVLMLEQMDFHTEEEAEQMAPRRYGATPAIAYRLHAARVDNQPGAGNSRMDLKYNPTTLIKIQEVNKHG